MIPERTHKRCTSCCEWLPFKDFPAHKRMHNGLSSHCRACHRAATQDWRERNRDEINVLDARPTARVSRTGTRRLELQRGRSPDGETSRVSLRTRSLISAFR